MAADNDERRPAERTQACRSEYATHRGAVECYGRDYNAADAIASEAGRPADHA